MWEHGLYYSLAALAVIVALLTFRYWGAAIYVLTKNWRVVTFTVILSGLGVLIVLKQQDLKYDLALAYFLKIQEENHLQVAYQVRQCKDFVTARYQGQPAAEIHKVSAIGPVQLGAVSKWELCARTFGTSYWTHDISIDGHDGGRLLCEAYARSTYRSGKVDVWCDTVFAPSRPRTEDQKI